MNDTHLTHRARHAQARFAELGPRVLDDWDEQRRYMRTPQRMASVLHWWIVRARIGQTTGLGE